MPESLLWNCFHQLAEALNFIHYGYDERSNHGISPTRTPVIHGDIKPENIFLHLVDQAMSSSCQYPSLVLGDFGFASFHDSSQAGTHKWQPPETPVTSKGADVWATGAVIHAMAHKGKAPIAPLPVHMEDTDQNRLIWYQSRDARDPIPLDGYYSKRLHDIVFDALYLNPLTRATSLELFLSIPLPLDIYDV